MRTTDFESRMTSKGQVTIPVEVRRKLGLQPKDRVRFKVEDNRIVIEPVESMIRKNFGAVKPRQYPEDFRKIREEVEHAIAEEAIARARRD